MHNPNQLKVKRETCMYLKDFCVAQHSFYMSKIALFIDLPINHSILFVFYRAILLLAKYYECTKKIS